MWTTAVIIFMLGLVSEQIAALRMERQHATPKSWVERIQD
jgi:hypothetical protein